MQKNNAKNTTLVQKICELKESSIRKTIDRRIKEFRSCRKMPDDAIFSELCFCITTANCSAETCIKLQQELAEEYNSLPEDMLSARLMELGYRFPNKRAMYITNARTHKEKICSMIRSDAEGENIREWLAGNVAGIGYKEASHFLRNVGYDDLAIIDFHIIDILSKYGIIDKPKTLSKKKYLEIEHALRDLAKQTGLTLPELDLYLWYMETGKVLK